jgi:hypothetical protein
MATELLAKAHAITIRMDIREVIRQLNGHLGATLVATLAGVSDRKLPYRWAKPDGPIPGDEAQQRLLTAHRIWLALAKNEADHAVRAWFIGANPVLDETPPVMALRAGETRDVLKAADAFIDGTWHD